MSKVTNLYSSGARPFQEFAEIMKVEKAGKMLQRLELWNRTYTRAGTEVDENGTPKQYTTPTVMEIATRYASILNDKGVDQTQLALMAVWNPLNGGCRPRHQG